MGVRGEISPTKKIGVNQINIYEKLFLGIALKRAVRYMKKTEGIKIHLQQVEQVEEN